MKIKYSTRSLSLRNRIEKILHKNGYLQADEFIWILYGSGMTKINTMRVICYYHSITVALHTGSNVTEWIFRYKDEPLHEKLLEDFDRDILPF